MTKKFVLLPEEVFSDFMARGDKAPNKPSIDQVLGDKRLNPSARNELYAQNLDSYLRHKKNTDQRPMRVRMAHSPEPIDDSIFIPRRPGALFSTEDEDGEPEDPDFDDDDMMDALEDPNAPAAYQATPIRRPPLGTPLLRTAPPMLTPATNRPNERYLDMTQNRDLNRSLQKIATINRPSPRLAADRKMQKERYMKTATTILKALKKNANFYRVGPNDTVLREDRKAVYAGSKNGDALLIIRKILGDPDTLPTIPTAFSNYSKFLEGEETSATLLNEARDHLSQIGGGWIRSKSPIRFSTKRSSFKPQKWKRLKQRV